MTERLHVAARPCSTCPYRRDTPPGIWHEDEYAKLATFDPPPAGPMIPRTDTFRCHQQAATERPTACRGWLSVHAETVAVRLAVIYGRVTVDEVYADVDVDLYATGAEAAAAGLDAARRPPTPEAAAQIRKLLDRGVGAP